jgi:Tfp pilus assembly protein PilF
MLQACPQWIEGHLHLGEEALITGDIATAYASAHAVFQLESAEGSLRRAQARFLLGRCYLRRGDSVKAVSELLPLIASKEIEYQVREELAAAFMAQGDVAAAKMHLEAVPIDKLSQAGMAALKYVRSKG